MGYRSADVRSDPGSSCAFPEHGRGRARIRSWDAGGTGPVRRSTMIYGRNVQWWEKKMEESAQKHRN